MPAGPMVFVVDDDPQVRDSACNLVRSMRLDAEPFASAEEFLQRYDAGRPGCLVTDVRMFGMSGLELLDELNRRHWSLPVIMVTAYARTPLTVRAIRAGALTVLEKPCNGDELWDAIRLGIAEDAARRAREERRERLRARFARLTPAERQVMDLVVEGIANKVISKQLDVSVRTVEGRRSAIFAKLQVDSVAQLVRLVIDAGLESSPFAVRAESRGAAGIVGQVVNLP